MYLGSDDMCEGECTNGSEFVDRIASAGERDIAAGVRKE